MGNFIVIPLVGGEDDAFVEYENLMHKEMAEYRRTHKKFFSDLEGAIEEQKEANKPKQIQIKKG